ncbi:MAG TPA: alpha/beta fold hydrolase [Vicinamibacterales bacterium]|nr:alpha/beta fold hydrolase [Vicinamibacterales bacterium]
MLREIAGPAGRLEALLDEPAASRSVGLDGLVAAGGTLRAAVVLAHPLTSHGGTMHTKAVYQAAKALSRIGCAVLRINFRGAGSSAGTSDGGPGEMDDFRAAIDFVADRYPGVSIWSGGMSFGSWIAMTVGAADSRVTTLIGIATAANHYDFDAVAKSPKGKFFIHGERDEICPLKDVQALYARAVEPKELVVIDTADHLFDGKVSEVADAIEDLLGDWNH